MTSRSSARTSRNRAPGRRTAERGPLAWAAMKPTTQGVTMNAAAAALTDQRVLIDHNPPAVAAHVVARRYGAGYTAYHPLRRVSLECPDNQQHPDLYPANYQPPPNLHLRRHQNYPTQYPQ